MEDANYSSSLNILSQLTNLQELEVRKDNDYPSFWHKSVVFLTLLKSLHTKIYFHEAPKVLVCLTNLTKLHLGIAYDRDDVSPEDLFPEEENVDEDSTQLCKCSTKDPNAIQTLELFRTLQSLTKLQNLFIHVGALNYTSETLTTLTQLTTLTFFADNLDPCFPLHISTLTNLQSLIMYWTQKQYSPDEWDLLFKPFKNLQHLHLDGFQLTENLTTSTFINQLKSIQNFAVRKEVTTPLSNLTYLHVPRKYFLEL
jgi:hypothetical protein